MPDPTLGDIWRLRRLFDEFTVGCQGEADQVAWRDLLLKSAGAFGSSIDLTLRRIRFGCLSVPGAAVLFTRASLVS